MMRYGEDFGRGRGRMRHAPYDFGFRSPRRAPGEFDAGYGRPGSGAEPWGWSRPEFNVSFGYPKGRPGWEYDEHGSGGEGRFGMTSPRDVDPPRSPNTWRTGQPWGDGYGEADRIRARDLMTENPEAVTPDTSLAAVAMRMRDLDVGIIPVIDDADRGILRGVITDRDIAIRAVADAVSMDSARVGDYMSTEVSSVDEADAVRDIFTVMKRERVRRVPVTDFTGRLVGIVALADLAVDYARLDEDRELEVEEVIGRISEPARPRPHRGGWDDQESDGAWHRAPRAMFRREVGGRVQDGWRAIKREARGILRRGYDRQWDPFDR